jgi:acetate kinase
LSYSYLLQEFEQVAGSEAAHGKVIFAHLGNGASLAALQGGKPIDTSMGLTPAGGIPMSTRSGDLDPGLLTYLATEKNMSAEELGHMTGFESGLLGISETSSDMKKLLDSESDDSRAKEAVDIFCYQTRKFIGAYAAALGGLDSLVFSGGIGEVSAAIRGRVCHGLDFLGISLDDGRNEANSERISVDGARVGVHVLATNEALSIARDMQQLVTKNN